MPRKGCDYAWGRPSISAFNAGGYTFACRYLSTTSSAAGKNLSREEAQYLQAAGIDIVSNWENSGSWAEYSQGAATGRAHAFEAARQHTACGGPAGRPIYFSADFSPTTAQMATVAAYYRGVASAIGLDRTGAYGGYPAIKYLFDAGVIRWGWQTYAWSSGRWDNRAQIRQTQNGVSIGGVDSDVDYAMVDDFGQWSKVGDIGMDPNAQDILPGQPNKLVERHMLGTLWQLQTGEKRNDLTLWDDLPNAIHDKLDALVTRPVADGAALAQRLVDVEAKLDQLARGGAVDPVLNLADVEALIENALRRVLGGLDGATPTGG